MAYDVSAREEEVVIIDDDSDAIPVVKPRGSAAGSAPTHKLAKITQTREPKHDPQPRSFGQPPQLVATNAGETVEAPFAQTSNAAYFATPSWQFPQHDRSSSSTSRIPSPNVAQPIGDSPGFASSPGRNLQLRRSLVSPTMQNEAIRPSSIARAINSKPLSTSVSERYLSPTDITEDDDEDKDYMDEDEFAVWLSQQHEEETRTLSGASDSTSTTRRKSSIIIPRNLPILHPLERIDEYIHKGILLAPNKFVELQDGDFMQILHIVKDTSNFEITLRGFLFRRTKEMNGLLDRRLNEVCWILHVDEDDSRDPLVQGAESRAVTEVVRRRDIRLTNRPFPDLSFRENKKDTQENVTNYGVLVCRYKYLCLYHSARARLTYTWCEKGLHRLREDECDNLANNGVKDDDLRYAWRGVTISGGAKQGWLAGEKEFLRQETICHRGQSIWQSLKVAGGPSFAPEDPMQRIGVSSILFEEELSNVATTSTTSTSQQEKSIFSPKKKGKAAEPRGATSSDACPIKPHRNHIQASSPFSSFRQSSYGTDDYGAAEAAHLFDLPQIIDIDTQEISAVKDDDPHVIEIDAEIKTSSSMGVLKKRYEGRITSTYIPSISSRTKCSIEESTEVPPIPVKRPRLNSFRHPNIENSAGHSLLGVDSPHRNLLFTQTRPDDSIEEISDFSKSSSHKTKETALWTPQSSSCRANQPSSVGIDLSDSLSGSIYYPRQIPDNDADVIDLTAPRSSDEHHTHAKFRQPSSYLADRPSRSDFEVSPSPYTASQGSLVPGTKYSSLPRSPSKTTKHCTTRDFAFDLTRNAPSLPHNSIAKGKVPLRATPVSDRQVQAKVYKTTISKSKQQRYTFGDCFCGAGGMSRGAVSAGLRINWGFDFDLTACESYEMNLFGTKVYNVAADQFANAGGDHKVDICHLSPPCQFFSDAHTHQGKDDEMNTASLFAIFNLLQKTKPRVATLEQTAGLIRRHPIFFNAVINMFTSKGFSVRWKVMNCADFGLPQRRMRLFIIASCPGEPLPPFPTPTHTAHPHPSSPLKPWTTISTALAPIPTPWPNHHPHLVKQRNLPPTSGSKIAACVTTKGGQGNVHPSGTRDYTHREFACLQGFPLGHKFRGKGVKRQIGNGVPPVVAEVILRGVREALERVDGVGRGEER